MEPIVGIEPTTHGLQDRCSTAELYRRISFTLLFHHKPYQLFFLSFDRIRTYLLGYAVAN